MGDSRKKRKRVETVSDAALMLGISRQRLQEMQKVSPWWADDLELKTEEGFDVVGIALAQAEHHHREHVEKIRAEVPKSDYDERMQKAELAEAEEQANVRRLERQKRERVELQAAGELVLVAVVQSLLREALGELRRELDDLPFVFSQQVPPEFRPQCFTMDLMGAKQISDLAPLQRIVQKRIENFERWLDRIPAEMFDESQAVADAAKQSAETEGADDAGGNLF